MSKPPYTALIVEDNQDWLEIFLKIVNANSQNIFDFIHAADLKTALSILKVNKEISLILLDLLLPDSHPFDTVKTITKEIKHIPVVVLTTFDDERLMEEAITSGAEDYLVKDEYDEKIFFHTTKMAIIRHLAKNKADLSEDVSKITERLSSIIGLLDKYN